MKKIFLFVLAISMLPGTAAFAAGGKKKAKKNKARVECPAVCPAVCPATCCK